MTESDLKSVADLHRYSKELATRSPQDDPRIRKLHTAKRIVWWALAAAAFLFYYLIDKLYQALNLL